MPTPASRSLFCSCFSPLAALLAVKLIALGLGILVWHMGRRRLLARINILFAILVTWNLLALIVAAITMA